MEISKYQAELADQQQIQTNWTTLSQTMMNITGKKKAGKASKTEMKWRLQLTNQATSIKQPQAFLKKILKAVHSTVGSTDSLGSAESLPLSSPKRRRITRKGSLTNSQDPITSEILRSRVTYSEPVDWTRRMPDSEFAADNVPEALLRPLYRKHTWIQINNPIITMVFYVIDKVLAAPIG